MILPPNVLSWEVLVPVDHVEVPARAQIRSVAHDLSGVFLAGGLPGTDLVQLIHIPSVLQAKNIYVKTLVKPCPSA